EIIFLIRALSLTGRGNKPNALRNLVHQVEVTLICSRRVVHASSDQLHTAAIAGIREDKALLCFQAVDSLAKHFHPQRGLLRIANVGVVEQKVRNVARGIGLWIEEGK